MRVAGRGGALPVRGLRLWVESELQNLVAAVVVLPEEVLELTAKDWNTSDLVSERCCDCAGSRCL